MEVLAALRALAMLRELDYDKASFRHLVAPYLRSADGSVRAAALYALFNTAPQPEDLTTLLAMVSDPSAEVRSCLTHVVTLYSDYKIVGQAADVVLTLLNDDDARVRRGALTTLWGASVDDRIAAHFLVLAGDPKQRHDAIYFGLAPRAVSLLARHKVDQIFVHANNLSDVAVTEGSAEDDGIRRNQAPRIRCPPCKRMRRGHC